MSNAHTLLGSSGRTLARAALLAVVVCLVVGALAGASTTAAAVPSPSDEHTLTQPDGTAFEAIQWGNEFNHGWEATNGYTITQGADGWWWYATTSDGDVVPTDRKVGIDSPPADVPKHVRGDAQTSPELESSTTSGSDGPSLSSSSPDSASAMPATGDVNLPVVLINYSDTTTNYTTTDFQNLLFGDDPSIASGPGSMKDFYQEASYGQLNISGGSAGVTGWETANNTHDYYGSGSIDSSAAELAREAVRKADDEMNFSEYDNDNDGSVDGVIVIHQGPGEEASADSSDIWSHRWSFTGAGLDAYQTDDGVTVNSYSLQPETYRNGITTVGVVAHETGHLFGMTDLYDTNGGSEGIGDWGLMGGGSWNGVNRAGDSPAHPVAFHKWQQSWITPTEKNLTGDMGTLDPYAGSASVFRWLDNPGGVEIGGTGEYFLATNRQRAGFDSALPGEGMLVTHVDETQSNNDNESHKLVDIEAADGERDLDKSNNQGDSGDTFPGTTLKRTFNKSTTPSSLFYNDTPTGLAIPNLYTAGNTIVLESAPVALVDPTAIDYGTIRYTTNVSANVTIANDGNEPLNVTSTSIAGSGAGNFTISAGGGEQIIDPGTAVDLNVTFQPSDRGNYSATLRIEHNASGSPSTVSLTGSGGAPDYNVTPSSVVDFGNISVEAGSAQADVVVENNGTLPLNISEANISGDNASDFSLASGSPTLPNTVQPNETSTYTVNVSVDSLGERTAFLELTHDVPDREPINLTLTATGVDRNPPTVQSARAVEASTGTTAVGPNASVTLSADVSDAVGVQSVTANASVLGAGNVTLTDENDDSVYDSTVDIDAANATEGDHVLTIEGVDTSGQSTTNETNILTVDLTAPVIEDATLDATDGILPETAIGVNVSASDTVSSVSTVTANGTALQADAGAWSGSTIAASDLGPATATVTVVDAAGNRNTTTLDYDVGRNATLQAVNGSMYRATPSDTPVISAVSMNATTNVSGEQVTVGTATTNPTGVATKNDTALYFPQVNTTVANLNISNATVSLLLSKQRLAGQYVHADSTAFWVLDGESWTRLNATLRNETDTAYVYDLHTDHFSTFAVTGDTEDTPPTISALRPSDGSSTTDRTPTIAASYTDDFSGIDASSVTLSIDGRKISSGLSVSDSEVSYTPPSALPLGGHSVTVTVADDAGNTQSRSWSFTVEEVTADGDTGGGGGGGTDGGGTGGGGGSGGGQTGATATTTTTQVTTVSNATTTVTTATPTATTAEPTTANATTELTETVTETPTATVPATTARGGAETSGSIPGFGVVAALVAVLAASLLALRRDA